MKRFFLAEGEALAVDHCHGYLLHFVQEHGSSLVWHSTFLDRLCHAR